MPVADVRGDLRKQDVAQPVQVCGSAHYDWGV
jgi:hypothetical protein